MRGVDLGTCPGLVQLGAQTSLVLRVASFGQCPPAKIAKGHPSDPAKGFVVKQQLLDKIRIQTKPSSQRCFVSHPLDAQPV